MNKKAIVGIGTLIVFIAGIIVASVSAGVIIITQQKVQQDALRVGREAQSSVTTTILLQSVRATNNNLGFDQLELRIQLAEGGEDVKLNSTGVRIVTSRAGAIMTYSGSENSYFITKKERILDFEINTTQQNIMSDIDNDYVAETMSILNSTTIRINLSRGKPIDITTPDTGSAASYIYINETIFFEGYPVGHLIIDGTTTAAHTLPENSVTLTFDNPERGTYSARYLIKAKSHMYGAIRYGDLILLTLEFPQKIEADENIEIIFHTPDGIPVSTVIYVPQVITEQYINLFP